MNELMNEGRRGGRGRWHLMHRQCYLREHPGDLRERRRTDFGQKAAADVRTLSVHIAPRSRRLPVQPVSPVPSPPAPLHHQRDLDDM